MTALITDRLLEERLIAQRQATGADRFDEVWDGVYIMSPLANMEHQRIATQFVSVLVQAMKRDPSAEVIGPINVSDRELDWTHNYRIPDAVVILPGCPAKDCETHLCGGPDFVAEIVSEGDRTYEKFGFYAAIGVREFLIIDRDPWQLEIYSRGEQGFQLHARGTLADGNAVASQILPLAFRLFAPAKPGRPQIEIMRTTDGQRWLA
ncbi:MAG: Uma2 family endonuclease [Pirellulaceae bacterium]